MKPLPIGFWTSPLVSKFIYSRADSHVDFENSNGPHGSSRTQLPSFTTPAVNKAYHPFIAVQVNLQTVVFIGVTISNLERTVKEIFGGFGLRGPAKHRLDAFKADAASHFRPFGSRTGFAHPKIPF